MVIMGLDTADAEVLTAFSPESSWDGRLDRFGVTDAKERQRLRDALQRVRADGVAYDRDRWRPGVCAVAAPVLDAAGHAIASVSVVLPSERATGGRLEEHSGAVIAAADAISRAGADVGGALNRESSTA
jgi:IclR family acetate operon transcriptional repressor